MELARVISTPLSESMFWLLLVEGRAGWSGLRSVGAALLPPCAMAEGFMCMFRWYFGGGVIIGDGRELLVALVGVGGGPNF